MTSLERSDTRSGQFLNWHSTKCDSVRGSAFWRRGNLEMWPLIGDVCYDYNHDPLHLKLAPCTLQPETLQRHVIAGAVRFLHAHYIDSWKCKRIHGEMHAEQETGQPDIKWLYENHLKHLTFNKIHSCWIVVLILRKGFFCSFCWFCFGCADWNVISGQQFQSGEQWIYICHWLTCRRHLVKTTKNSLRWTSFFLDAEMSLSTKQLTFPLLWQLAESNRWLTT